MYHILLCDDEDDIRYALKIYLKNPEYVFHEAHDGAEAIEIVKKEKIDLLLLDIMMPRMDGIAAMKEIRAFSNIPIILLTAKGENEDKIEGFETGADDYITKPFEPFEVKARVSAQLRRFISLGSKAKSSSEMLKVGRIELDDISKTVFVNGEEVTLTFSEYEILKLLMKNVDKCFSPTEIYQHIWKENPMGSERTVSVHIRHLREKIEIDPAKPRLLQAVWGQGYRIVGAEEV